MSAKEARYGSASGLSNRGFGPGANFKGKRLPHWVARGAPEFIRLGKPVENASIESFNGRLRDERLNEELFFWIGDARRKLEAWRIDYNNKRPNSSLGDMSPREYARPQTGRNGWMSSIFSKRSGLLAIVLIVLLAGAAYLWLTRSGMEEVDRKVEKFLHSRNKDFEFVGRIVDQDGVPVPGVVVDALVSVARIDISLQKMSDRESIVTTTDANGEFRLRGNGRSLRLAFDKSGYRFAPQNSFTLDQMTGAEFERFNVGLAKAFQAWRISSAPSADVRTGRGYHKIVADGSFQSIFIERRRNVIEVSMTRAPDGSFDNPSGWTAALRLPDGALVQADSNFLFEAPASGYVPRWSISHNKGAEDFKDRSTHSFFFRADGGHLHGALTIEFRPYYNVREESSVAVEYRINPTGSRNLLSPNDR